MNRKQPNVLLIDDIRNGSIVRRDMLEEKGYLVTIVSSGSAGLRAFDRGDFDIVVTDYKMPKMNGRQVVAEIRERSPQTPVIILSGCVEQLGLTDELAKEADAVLSKSATELKDLLRTVVRLLRRRATSARTSVAKTAAVKTRRKA